MPVEPQAPGRLAGGAPVPGCARCIHGQYKYESHTHNNTNAVGVQTHQMLVWSHLQVPRPCGTHHTCLILSSVSCVPALPGHTFKHHMFPAAHHTCLVLSSASCFLCTCLVTPYFLESRACGHTSHLLRLKQRVLHAEHLVRASCQAGAQPRNL